MERSNIANEVIKFVEEYIQQQPSEKTTHLYQRIMEAIEPPLFDIVMAHSRFSQSKAARTLGLSRGTTRQKLIRYFGDKYCSHKDVE